MSRNRTPFAHLNTPRNAAALITHTTASIRGAPTERNDMFMTFIRITRAHAADFHDKINPSGAQRRRHTKLTRYYRWWATQTDQRATRCRQQGILDAADMYLREAHDLRKAADMLDTGATEQDVQHLLPPPF
ncbi:hypothetical protein [Mycobacteroides abscessus]|uniref:hypothetical protein n=1 Tax=Mycobacteroides abscessus TaxID=36809 RepID=UPI0009A87420|nr:hypothetical protein [Mycobacteroides abscessus]SKO15202.1 Uncharacterised protein [Mycobacteroides abscessus subsp. bolletii]SKX37428.1 Uncharacterised protein [Mycobacteroides abscessus subsp. bolletii]